MRAGQPYDPNKGVYPAQAHAQDAAQQPDSTAADGLQPQGPQCEKTRRRPARSRSSQRAEPLQGRDAHRVGSHLIEVAFARLSFVNVMARRLAGCRPASPNLLRSST